MIDKVSKELKQIDQQYVNRFMTKNEKGDIRLVVSL